MMALSGNGPAGRLSPKYHVMESTISIEQFREELQSWKRELSSIKEEISYFEQHLESLTGKKLPKDLLAEVEHFQNLFICQKEVIDKLRHDLPDSRVHVEHIFQDLRSSRREERWESPSDGLEERMDTFRKIYIEIKQDFHRFDEEWM
jgi:predicted RNase H-like nuclease (RuvC/YqgF family)